MRNLLMRFTAATRVAQVLVCFAILVAGAASAQPPTKDSRVVQPTAALERPERPRSKPPSFVRRLISIVFSDQLEVPKP